jgi:hypothetical protein
MSRGYGSAQKKILAKLREWPEFFLDSLLPIGWNNRSDMVVLARAARNLADQDKIILSYDDPSKPNRLFVSRPETFASRFIQRFVVQIGPGRYQVLEGYRLSDEFMTEGEANRLRIQLEDVTGDFGGRVVGWAEAGGETESNPAIEELRRQVREVMREAEQDIAQVRTKGERIGQSIGEVGRDLRRIGLIGGYVFKTTQRSPDFIDRCNEPGEQIFRRKRELATRDHKRDFAANINASTEPRPPLDDKYLRDPLTPAWSERERQTGEPEFARDDEQMIDTTCGGFGPKGRDGPHTEGFRGGRGRRRRRPKRR